MQRLRSFRESFRRNKRHKDAGKDNSGVNHWHSDEIGVRQGNCTFAIKYLGCVEVFESKGMPICEEALKVLRGTKRKSIRGTLFVSGDGLRVVDGETRGLIVDQTIEKVSFCAPDRNNERGFAYICRDGATRRWMCHGFNAVGNTGERLSHAVGCAFAICLERKLKREREAAELAAVAAAYHLNNNGNLKNHSTHNSNNCEPPLDFKIYSTSNNSSRNNLSYHLLRHNFPRSDPQTLKVTEPPPVKPVINPYAIDRPHATPLMLQRQTSFRPLGNLRSQSPFKRQLSLRLTGTVPEFAQVVGA